MNTKRKGKKGITLVEMSVVIALIAIVSAVVISFSLLVSQRVSVSTARLNAMNDLDLVEGITEGWMTRMTMLGADLSREVDADTLHTWLQAEIGTEVYTLSFDEEEKVLKGTLPGDEVMTGTPKQVQGVEYDGLLGKIGESDYLCVCTVVYELPHMASEETAQTFHTFCVNPHVGDTYGDFQIDLFPDDGETDGENNGESGGENNGESGDENNGESGDENNGESGDENNGESGDADPSDGETGGGAE